MAWWPKDKAWAPGGRYRAEVFVNKRVAAQRRLLARVRVGARR